MNETNVPTTMASTADGTGSSGLATLSQGRLAGIALALLALLFVAVNVLATQTLTSTRLDLTEERLFSLDRATKDMLGGMKEPVTLKFYYSSALGRQLPYYGIYAGRVRDLLDEYVALSGGKIRLEIYDPEPFTELEDRAVADGLQQVPLEQGGEEVFFGIAGTNLTDDLETIPFLQPEREKLLEYDISRLVHALITPKKTVVGILSGLPLQGSIRPGPMGQQTPIPPYVVYDQIAAGFETRYLGQTLEKVPDEVTVLLVAHPNELGERALFAIDQFVLAGGKALIFVDPYSEAEGGQQQMLGRTTPESSDLPRLFKAWGLEFDPTKVATDRLSARKVQIGQGQRPLDYVAWLELRGGNIDRDSPITANVGSITAASAGFLKLAKDAPVTMTPLITTAPGASVVDAAKVKGMPDIEGMLRSYEPGPEKLVIAARLTADKVKSAFPEGLPVGVLKAEKEGESVEQQAEAYRKLFPTVLSESKSPLDVIVVADSDILADRFWVQVQQFFGRRVPVPVSANGDFVLNALDALSGSSALLGLRGRGSTARPFDVIQNIQREAAAKFATQEENLRRTLADTERRLNELRSKTPGGKAAIVTEEEQAEIAKYRKEILRIRGELRSVQRSVREDVERLETRMWFYNIALVPILVTFAAIGLAVWRARSRRRAANPGAHGQPA